MESLISDLASFFNVSANELIVIIILTGFIAGTWLFAMLWICGIIDPYTSQDKGLWVKRIDAGRFWRHRRIDVRSMYGVQLYRVQDGICPGCGEHYPYEWGHIDHIIPLSRGGSNHLDNLQWLCATCNLSKGSKTMVEFLHYRQLTYGW